jgi:hypothetical protein
MTNAISCGILPPETYCRTVKNAFFGKKKAFFGISLTIDGIPKVDTGVLAPLCKTI